MSRSQRLSGQAGSLTAFTALFIVALIAVAGLVVDGGRYLAARQGAVAAAEQAARAGADALDTASLRAGTVTVDPSLGVSAAESALASDGLSGTASVEGASVSVTVAPFEVATTLMRVVGLSHFTVEASAEATALHGVAAQD